MRGPAAAVAGMAGGADWTRRSPPAAAGRKAPLDDAEFRTAIPGCSAGRLAAGLGWGRGAAEACRGGAAGDAAQASGRSRACWRGRNAGWRGGARWGVVGARGSRDLAACLSGGGGDPEALAQLAELATAGPGGWRSGPLLRRWSCRCGSRARDTLIGAIVSCQYLEACTCRLGGARRHRYKPARSRTGDSPARK